MWTAFACWRKLKERSLSEQLSTDGTLEPRRFQFELSHTLMTLPEACHHGCYPTQWTHSPSPCVLKQKTFQQKKLLNSNKSAKTTTYFWNCVLVFRQGCWNNLNHWSSMFWHKWLPALHHTAIIHVSNGLDHFFMWHESDIHIFHFYKHNNVWSGWHLKCVHDDSNVEFK